MRARAITLALRYPALLLVAAALLTTLSLVRLIDPASGELRLGIDSTLSGLLPRTGAALDTYAETAQRFGGDDVVYVAWLSDELFSRDVLQRLKRLARDLSRIEGVRAVDSLAGATRVRVDDDLVEVTRLLAGLPRTQEGLAKLAADARADPLHGPQLLTPDGNGTLLVVRLAEALDAAGLARTLEAIGVASETRASGAPVRALVTGPVVARLALGGALFEDVRRALPLAVLVTALIAAMTLRSVRGVLLPLAATGSALAVTLAVFAARGHAFNFVTVIVPPVIFVVGFALAVHVINAFDTAFRVAGKKHDGLAETMRELWQPLSLTAFTTAIGFASLATSNIDSIRVFGLYTALGTMAAWLAALFLIPAALALWPARVLERSGTSPLTALGPALARFDARHRRVILAGAALLALASIALATRIEVSTDYLANFSASSSVRQDYEAVREAFGGANPLQVVVTSELPQAFADPIHLAAIETLEQTLERNPGISNVTSVVDFIETVRRAFAPEAPTTRRVPDSREAIEDIMELGAGEARDRFVDRRFSTTVLHVTTPAVATRDLARVIADIEGALAALPPHLHGEVTGGTALIARTLDDIVRGQLVSLGGALLVIYGILYLLFGSARVAAIALLPNALPIVAFFGVLGATGVTLNLATSLVASVVLGIAVDDSIHFLSRFNAEARRSGREDVGIERALGAVIRPVTFTTMALCAGFATLTTGELTSQVEFGALAAVVLFLAWVLDLTFTPAIATRLRFVTLWETLTADLGAAPHETIPLFRGLTHRQARIAAILGQVVEYPAGTRVITLGERGHDVHIVIDGELAASVPRDDRDVLLRHLGRGDLIGEVALFAGTRTANVDAVSDVRLIRFDQAALDRIATRYPRIASVLYRNLGTVMAERLADVTAQL